MPSARAARIRSSPKKSVAAVDYLRGFCFQRGKLLDAQRCFVAECFKPLERGRTVVGPHPLKIGISPRRAGRFGLARKWRRRKNQGQSTEPSETLMGHANLLRTQLDRGDDSTSRGRNLPRERELRVVRGEEGDRFPQNGRVVVDASQGQVPTNDPLSLERHGRRGKISKPPGCPPVRLDVTSSH